MPPRSFIITVTFLLALLHAYIGVRILPALPGPGVLHVLGGLWLLLSFVLVPLGLLARAIRPQPLSDRLAWIGLMAMGLFSSLLVLTFLRDIGLLVAGAIIDIPAAWISGTAAAVPLLSLIASAAGYANARRVAPVVDVEIALPGLPPALQGFTIAQISDIHVGPTIKGAYLSRIVERVNALDADLIAVTGDLVDGSVAELSSHTAPLAQLRARDGAFFVTGNHEYYSGVEDWIAQVKGYGLRVLMNEHVVLQRGDAQLVVAGVPDFGAHHFDPRHRSDPKTALAGAPADAAARILLAHQPRSARAAEKAGFDLQLSGHTHGGQFFPWNLFVPLQQPFTAGLHRLQRLWVYVSRGTGYWGPPKRFGAPSEITRLRLVRSP
ncbi:metallophosphoesterase [Niveibacterium sp. SC-1]|uniref:metallophosphoesterase n=1 Tax=Niveibacterium sp. SC-1 TaxID=3135646 RepID=UPI00311F2167